MQPHELRRAEDVRATNDIRVADVRDWVGEQLGHPDPRIAAAAQQVLDGDLAVWELVDLVLGDDDLRSGAAATLEWLQQLPAEQVAELRREVGAGAASLRALLQPSPDGPGAEAGFYLGQMGVLDEVTARVNEQLAAEFPSAGLEERLGEEPAAEQSAGPNPFEIEPADDIDPDDPTNPFGGY